MWMYLLIHAELIAEIQTGDTLPQKRHILDSRHLWRIKI